MYFAPFVDDSGLNIPTYADILEKRIADFKAIYGQDAYVDIDSAEYQEIAVQSLALYDAFQAILLIWNQMSPTTAIGAGLSANVKYNGLTRATASYSTCEVVLTGTAPVTILNGIVEDTNGVQWSLPVSVTLVQEVSPDDVYSATVQATCNTIGAITALSGDISKIVTPTAGWTEVTNDSAAVTGLPVETDAELRERQALSVALPSLSRKEGTIARIAALDGVTRYKVYENPTNGADGYGHPEHSITCVVEGGTDADIAAAILNNKTIGCYINGTTEVSVVDSQGLTDVARFYRPTFVPIYVNMDITRLTGYTSATTDAIEAAVVAYLNSLQIGERVTMSAIYGAALSVMPTLNEPLFSITSVKAATIASPLNTVDITMTFAQVASGVLTNVSVDLT